MPDEMRELRRLRAALIDAFEGERLFGHIRLTHCERSEVASLAAERL